MSNKHIQNNNVLKTASIQAFSGPIPPPDVLQKFEEVLPGSAERIIKMAEEQSIHRRELEKNVIDSDISRSKWGQILGFLIAVTGLLASVFIAVYGNAIAGSILGFGTLVSLVSVFMYGSKVRSVEREKKYK